MTEENQDIENYGTMPDLDKLNQMNQERLQKDIPKKEIGGVKPEDKPKAIQEPRELPKEDPVPSNYPEQPNYFNKNQEKKEIIKEYNNKPEVKANGVKLISKKTYNILIIALISILVLFTVNMIWDGVGFANKDFSNDVSVNPVNNINMTDADVTENTYENEYIINNYNNYTIIVGVNSS